MIYRHVLIQHTTAKGDKSYISLGHQKTKMAFSYQCLFDTLSHCVWGEGPTYILQQTLFFCVFILTPAHVMLMPLWPYPVLCRWGRPETHSCYLFNCEPNPTLCFSGLNFKLFPLRNYAEFVTDHKSKVQFLDITDNSNFIQSVYLLSIRPNYLQSVII